MAKIQLVCDTVCDLPAEYIKNNNIRTIKVPCIINGEEVFDISNQQLFEFVKQNGELPKTAAPSLVYYESYFEPLCKESDHVIFLCMSSGISSAYSNIIQLESTYKNLHIIDSKNLSGGIGLLLLQSINAIEKSVDIATLIDTLQQSVNSIKGSFILDTLSYLHKGGRCSTISLLGANLLKLKPQIVLNEGKMLLAKKFKGKIELAITDYCEHILLEKDKIAKDYIIIAYTTENTDILNAMAQKFKAVGIDSILCVQASSTIASHCGPNTYGVFYIEN